MNKSPLLTYAALGLSIVALAIAWAVALSSGNVPVVANNFGAASCSGVSGCTAFPGIMRVDVLQIGGATAGANQTAIASSGVVYATQGGQSNITLALTTSTSLASNFDCLYDTIQLATTTGSTAGNIIVTLPAATSTAATCLVADGTWEQTLFVDNSTSTISFATSTGDFFGSTTNGSSSIASSTNIGGNMAKLWSHRVNSSTVYYSLDQWQQAK